MPQVSIVIRCLNEERHLGRLLHGVMQQTLRDVVIVEGLNLHEVQPGNINCFVCPCSWPW
jgi:hypothetical protein